MENQTTGLLRKGRLVGQVSIWIDKNGREIAEGQEVHVPEPNPDDGYQLPFSGTVVGFRNGNVQVEDGDRDVWEIEPQRLSIATGEVIEIEEE